MAPVRAANPSASPSRSAGRVPEAGDDGKRRRRVVRHLLHHAVGRDAEHVPFEDHHLAVEVLEGSQSEVAVFAHDPDRHRALVDALHERAGGRHLVERVPLDPEELRQRALDQVINGCAAAARLLVQRGEHPGVDSGVELRHLGNVAGPPTFPAPSGNSTSSPFVRTSRRTQPREGTHASIHVRRRARARVGRGRRRAGSCLWWPGGRERHHPAHPHHHPGRLPRRGRALRHELRVQRHG